MSDFDSVLAGHPDTDSADAGFNSSLGMTQQQPSAGTLLRDAREAAGLHIATLAVSLKVPVKKLEALEQDRFDLLPDLVFARALASSVCRTLKLDPALVLARLPQTATPMLAYKSSGINTPFRSPRDGPGPSILAQVSRPAVLSVLVLLLGALVLIFLPVIKPPSEPVAMAGVTLSDNANPAVLPSPCWRSRNGYKFYHCCKFWRLDVHRVFAIHSARICPGRSVYSCPCANAG
ncbi:helix-turn-helix domain-containing protein [Polaromonas sp. P1-6]|nr:helix-turn-helix domain-containing protein [Polaromonas sp. P1-6]